jgi:hypothetical protein
MRVRLGVAWVRALLDEGVAWMRVLLDEGVVGCCLGEGALG